MQTMKHLILCLGLAGSMLACMPTGFLASRNSAPAPQSSVAVDPKTQSNDRPTETGAGVPGYLVNCSDINADGELLQVGCSVSNAEGKRVQATADSWTRYEVKLPPNVNPSITVTKSIAGGDDAWDVIFVFAGAPVAELRAAAQASTYSYSHPDEKGGTVKTETPPPVVATVPKPAAAQSCSDGVLVEGICMVTVSSSCTEYCDQSQMKVHPWVVERYGSGTEGNREACAKLYESFPDRAISSVVVDVVTTRGLGCHRQARGLTFFDSSPTDPSKSPFFGYSRICACQ